MTDKIKIDIISDVVCPWCILGYKRLEQAMTEMGVEDKFEIEWNPFELNPTMPAEGENIIEHMAHKYEMDPEKVRAYQRERAKNGEEVGFTFDSFEEMRIVNTRDAHILLDYAKEHGNQMELQMALFKAHFGERKNVSDRQVLEQIVKGVGLDERTAMLRLDDTDVHERIQEKETYWQTRGVTAVPTMVWNDDLVMNGAYPIETYKQVIKELLNEKNKGKNYA